MSGGCLLGISDLIGHVQVQLAGRQAMMRVGLGRPGCVWGVGVPGLREPCGLRFGVCSAHLQTQFSLFFINWNSFLFFSPIFCPT